MTTHEPGTVAMIGWNMTSGHERAILAGRWYTESGICVHPENVTDVRTLIVLDPEDIVTDAEGFDTTREDEIVKCLRRLADAETGKKGWTSWRGKVAERIAHQIEQQTRPPKPAEPMSVGSLVEDNNKDVWARHSSGEWVCLTVEKFVRSFASIDAVEVLR